MTPRCSNSESGWFNQECGKPADWTSTCPTNGTAAHYCRNCKRDGREARGRIDWRPAPQLADVFGFTQAADVFGID